jgi:hypothetical protein
MNIRLTVVCALLVHYTVAAPPEAPPVSGLASWKVVKDPPVDLFEVTGETRVSHPRNFGVNLRPMHFKPWSEFRFENLYNADVGFEPILARQILTLTGATNCTPTRIEELWMQKTRAGLSGWGKQPTGWWDGAHLVIYRIRDGAYAKIHETTVTKHVAERGKEEWIELADPGPVAENEDLLVFTKEMTSLPYPGDDPQSINKRSGFFKPANPKIETVRDLAEHAPENGGRSSLRIGFPGGRMEAVKHPFLQNREFYLMIASNTPMRCSVWLKRSSPGKVTVTVGKQASQAFEVGTEWKACTMDFTFNPALEPVNEESEKTPKGTPGIKTQPASQVEIASADPGDVWVDNLLIYDTRQAPLAPRKVHVDNLRQFQPGTIRFWDGSAINRTVTLDNWLRPLTTALSDPELKGVFGLPLPESLRLCRDLGAAPWYPLYPLFSEEELLHLMEYLGAPADVGYGKIRATQGQVRPWLAELDKIYLEVGNETWNTIFQDKAWPGRADLYAAVSERLFRVLKSSPYFDPKRIELVVCGWSLEPYRRRDHETGAWLMEDDKTKQWSYRALEDAPSATAVDTAWYYGGADGVTVIGENDRELFAQQLMYAAWICAPQAESFVTMRDELHAAAPARPKAGLMAYEGGPGYPMPRAAAPYSVEGEIIGKSMVAGLVTLDAYQYNQYLGFEAQNYYEYGIGNNFTSHTAENRPIPAWIALEMRNRLCRGDLMEVRAGDVKTFDIPTQVLDKINWKGEKIKRRIWGRNGITATACYAFQQGKEHSILLMNRMFDEARPIRLQLPYTPSPDAQVYILTAPDPRKANRFEENVKMSQDTLSTFQKDYTFTLPPASVYIIVNREK